MSKNALVTGSSHGIGAATAIALAQEGYNVGITYCKNPEGAKEIQAKCLEYGVEAKIYGADFQVRQDCEKLMEDFLADFGTIDVLVNNAGGALQAALEDHRTVRILHKQGHNDPRIIYNYRQDSDCRWLFIACCDEFGVQINGCEKRLIQRADKLGFGSVTSQTLPFYGANIDYIFDVELDSDRAIELETPYYRGSLIAVALDGQRVGRIVLPPYRLRLNNVAKGKHAVTLTLFGNRFNSFGPLHLINEGQKWIGPDAWRTDGYNWSYEYQLRRLGILKSPIVRIYSK